MSGEAAVVGVEEVVGDDADEEVVAAEEDDGGVDGGVATEEGVEGLEAAEAGGVVELVLAPLPPLLPLPFLGPALPSVSPGLLRVGIATRAVAACSPCLKPHWGRLQLPAMNFSHCGSLLVSPCSEEG